MKRLDTTYLIGATAWGAMLLGAVVMNFSDLGLFDMNGSTRIPADADMVLLAVSVTLLATAAFLGVLHEATRHVATLQKRKPDPWLPSSLEQARSSENRPFTPHQRDFDPR